MQVWTTGDLNNPELKVTLKKQRLKNTTESSPFTAHVR